MAQTVIGIFDNATQAQNAVQQLLNNGFTQDYIDVSSRSTTDTTTTGTDSSTYRDRDNDDFGDKVSRFFSNLFDSDDDRNSYSEVGRRGSVVTVHAQTTQEAQRAADILDQYGAVDVDERANQYRSGTYSDTNTAYTSDLNTARTTDFDETRDTNSIKVIEEELQVGKRVVNTGGVRLRSRIVERPVEETLRLREERVHIERNPVNRPATAADLNSFQEGTIEMTERAEVPVVNKEARVVEEVRLEKDVTEHEETIRDTVRRTDVDIEDLTTDTDRTRLSRDQDDLNRPGTL